MLITTNRMTEGKEIRFEKDKIIVCHAENVTEVLKANQQLRNDFRTNGFTKGRTMRLIGVVDNLAYFAMVKKYPEIEKGDQKQKRKAWKKAFNDPEFAGYKAVEGGI